MIRTVILTALALVALASNAEARQRHKAGGLHPECNVTMPCVAPYASTADQVRVTRGRYIARELGFGAAIEKRAARKSKPKARPALSYVAPSVPSIEGIARPVRYIAGRLICAVNVGAALAERGIKGTGSALALSYLHWGRSAGGPVPGAVIVSARRGGGHVAIVSRVQGGVVYAWNATGGQRGWREIPYRHRVLDYRVPG
jgi:hypothetical protein